MTRKLTDTILRFWPDACFEAIAWADQYDDNEGRAAWRDCERGDWMLGIAARLGVDRKAIVRACVDIAAVEVWRWDDVDDRPLAALEAALAWCEGEATIEEVRDAARAAWAAGYDADYDADDAADAVADAAACAAAYAADAADAADAAAAADAAVAATYADDARATSLRLFAEIVRRHVPWRMVRQAIAAKCGA